MERLSNPNTGILVHRELWATLAHLDLRNRYRGSYLGPLWLTIATGVLVAGIGVLYGGLFGQPLHEYLPYIAVSLVLWTFMSTAIAESTALFLAEGIIIKQLPLPATIFVTRLVYRNTLVLAHNVIVVVLVFIFFRVGASFQGIFVSLFSLAIVIANVWWIAAVVSVISARFRDIPPIVTSALQITFFVTPIIWSAKDLGEMSALFELNPVFHLLESVRVPLLSDAVPWRSLGLAAIFALFGSVFALQLLRWSRTRLVYWL